MFHSGESIHLFTHPKGNNLVSSDLRLHECSISVTLEGIILGAIIAPKGAAEA
jgi:hypothetical protein